MAATRRQPPLQIFQDPITSTEHTDVTAFEPHILEAFGSVTDVSSDHHTLLQPPQNFSHGPSPRKTRHVSSSPPPSALAEKGLNTVSLPPPMEPVFGTDAPAKKMQRPVPKQSPFTIGPRAPHFSSFTNLAAQFDKENMVGQAPLPKMAGFPVSEPPVKAGHKRSLTDSAPLRDRRSTKVKRDATVPATLNIEDGPLPAPEDMPPVEDDGGKPPFSYAQLIGMAILRAPTRRLTLAQIYKWISDTFAFYRNVDEGTGWQNSIRHNLSLSKHFSKHERPKDDPGKGHYWIINEGFDKLYFKLKANRRPTNPEPFVPAYHGHDLPRPSTANSASFPPPLSIVKSTDSSKFPDEQDLSSDATIPCSDPAAHDGVEPERVTMPPPRQQQIPSSPPAANIHSSPPPPVGRSVREDTPPRAPRFPTNSRSGGRKRKFNGLGDSGYYSSIESSATKGKPLGTLLTSEADLDRPSIKRGRAEEEIARIRGSSYDSPTKTRPFMKQPSNGSLMTSPFRSNEKNSADPLTPAIVFKRPALPPPSASPNTNLRNHRNEMRKLVGGSPDKNMSVWNGTSFLDLQNWSPAVQVPNPESVNLIGNGFENTFDIFGDLDFQESPLKPAAKRPRLERATTTSGILADITGNTPKTATTSTPASSWKNSFLNMPVLSPERWKGLSPMKGAPTSMPSGFVLNFDDLEPSLSPLKQAQGQTTETTQDDDIFHLLHSDESEPGIDLLQGFEKIGARASVAPNGSPTKAPAKASRPPLARSATTRF